MKVCSCEGCRGEGVHRWGKYWLCDECHERFLRKTQSEDKTPTINIPKETGRFDGGWYTNGEGAIYLIDSSCPPENILNHEFMHHVLNVFVSPQVSYDYDNIAISVVDPYHDL